MMKRTLCEVLALACIAFVSATGQDGAEKTLIASPPQVPAGGAPKFEVDPSWPKLPSKWTFGLEVSGIQVDTQDHVWVLHRPGTAPAEQKDAVAPPVVEFDAAGNFVQAWGGPGEGYQWPEKEHGFTIDHEGNVWIAGNGPSDNQLLKFTRDGKFLMQIGDSGQSTGVTDPKHLRGPQALSIYPKTNEVFVVDGMGSGRVIVFNAETGAFKRMWTAFGNAPTDAPPPPPQEEGPGASMFGMPHSVRVSNDGLVYVCDRGSQRIQVFTVDGKYQTQVFVSRDKAGRDRTVAQAVASRPADTAFGLPLKVLYEQLASAADSGATAIGVSFSQDPQQSLLYVAERSSQQVVVYDRKTLNILTSFGQAGDKPGEFYILHDLAVDSKGNAYTAEVGDHDLGTGRAQKFIFKGVLSQASTR